MHPQAPNSPIRTHGADTFASVEGGRHVVHPPGHRERKQRTKGVAKDAAKEVAAKAFRKEVLPFSGSLSLEIPMLSRAAGRPNQPWLRFKLQT